MIQDLSLDGFQKHTLRYIRFEPGLNVIVGDTDAGKSSIIRGLRWFALHEPTSADLIQHGSDSVFVGIRTKYGHTSRFKNSRKNGYRHDDEEFVACGTDQPLAIAQIHGLIAENFQSQHDPHFLLSLAPGQLAKEINRIVALDDIDAATRWLRTRSTGVSVSIADTEIELADAIKTRDEVKTRVDERERLFNLLTAARDRYNGINTQLFGMNTTLLTHASLMIALSATNAQTQLLEKVIAAKAALDTKEAAQDALGTILSAWRAVESDTALNACIEAAGALKSKLLESAGLAELQDRQITTEREILEVICSIRDTVSKAGAIVNALQEQMTKLSDMGRKRKRLDLEINSCQKQIQLCELSINNLPKTICPACGQETR